MSRNGAVYVADVSSMPAIITRLFALPKMRERPYRIMLADSTDSVSFLPRQPHAVTVIRLRDNKLASIDYVSTEAGLDDSF
jgi:NADPH-dependent ferric siderophore reductase